MAVARGLVLASLTAPVFVAASCGGSTSDAGSGLPSICQLPPETGPCNAAFRHFYFSAMTGHCEPFTYGGCQGSANNFETLAECQDVCGGSGSAGASGSGGGGSSLPVRCTLPAEAGICEAAMARFFHDPATGVCEPFTYGGCGGNENNFPTRAACDAACRGGPVDMNACETTSECVVVDAVDDAGCCRGCEPRGDATAWPSAAGISTPTSR